MPSSRLLPAADDPFWIDDPLTVRQIVADLSRRQVSLRCWIGQSEPVDTHVAEIRDSGEMALRFAAGQALPVAARPGEPAVLQARLGSARISFVAEDLRRDGSGESGLGVCRLPLSVNRLQRREFFRVPTPVSLLCELPGVAAGAGANGTGRRMVRLVDISVGGVCLALPAKLEPPLALDEPLAGCSLDLPDFGVIRFGLEFMNRPDEAVKGTEQLVGARFVGLSPRDQTLLQRFVYKLQTDARE